MAAVILEQPTQAREGEEPSRNSEVPRIRRVFRLEVPRGDGASDVWFVPMVRAEPAQPIRGALYRRPAGAAARTRADETMPTP
jgi:hypothetical protein